MPDRRQVVGWIGAGALASCAGPGFVEQEVDLQRRLDELADLGIRRTGSEGERRTADWLGQGFRAAGYDVRPQTFPVETLTRAEGKLRVGDKTVELFPQWMPPAGQPSQASVSAPIMLTEDVAPGAIALREVPAPFSAYWPAALDGDVNAAADRGAACVLVSVNTPADAIFAYNRAAEAPPHRLPVLLFARRDLERLKAAAQSGETAQLDWTAERSEALEGHSISGYKPGRGAGLVISTPISGWFHSLAERGPGILLIYQLARDLASAPYPVWLLGTGGHEIGHLGMKVMLASDCVPAPSDVSLWIHLGASIGATARDADYLHPSVHFSLATDDIRPAVDDIFGKFQRTPLDPAQANTGETGNVLQAGYTPLLGLTGVAATFHTPDDDGRAISFERLETYRQALLELIAHRLGGSAT